MAAKNKAIDRDFLTKNVVTERASDYAQFYVNHAQVGYTGFDVFAILSEAAHEHDGKIHLRQKARVSMSPMQALLLSRFLANAVRLYEEAFDIKVDIPAKVYKEEAAKLESGQKTI